MHHQRFARPLAAGSPSGRRGPVVARREREGKPAPRSPSPRAPTAGPDARINRVSGSSRLLSTASHARPQSCFKCINTLYTKVPDVIAVMDQTPSALAQSTNNVSVGNGVNSDQHQVKYTRACVRALLPCTSERRNFSPRVPQHLRSAPKREFARLFTF